MNKRGSKTKVAGARSELIGEMPRACADDRAAVLMLERLRWNGRPYCPRCGDENVYKMRDAKTGERNRDYRWRCRSCKRQYTWRIGTVAEESLIPARIWVYAFWRCATSKKGVSALELARQTGLTHKSALFLLHRVRWAAATDWTLPKPMEGTIEADEMYVCRGARKFGADGRPIRHESPVVGMLQRGGEVRAVVLKRNERVTAATLGRVLRENVALGARLHTDAAGFYITPGKSYVHESVDHVANEYVRGDVTTNRVEGFFGLIRRGLHGTWHSVSARHLHRYVAEFEFRFNHRFAEDGERVEALVKKGVGKRLGYRPIRNYPYRLFDAKSAARYGYSQIPAPTPPADAGKPGAVGEVPPTA
jgi:transposase-like protein